MQQGHFDDPDQASLPSARELSLSLQHTVEIDGLGGVLRHDDKACA